MEETKFDVPEGCIGCRSILEILGVAPEERERIMEETKQSKVYREVFGYEVSR